MSVYQKHKNRWFQHCRRKSNDKQVNCHTSSKIWAPWLLSTCSTNAVCLSLVRGESKPERHSGKRIIAGTAFRLEFLVDWYYDADATMAVPELY